MMIDRTHEIVRAVTPQNVAEEILLRIKVLALLRIAYLKGRCAMVYNNTKMDEISMYLLETKDQT